MWLSAVRRCYDADDSDAGGIETASGQPYDPFSSTAAIQIGLRGAFGGIHYSRNYHPAFALVEAGENRGIVKVNDVGPLRPSRVIDFSEGYQSVAAAGHYRRSYGHTAGWF